MRTKITIERVFINGNVEDVECITHYDYTGVDDIELYVDDDKISQNDIDNYEDLEYKIIEEINEEILLEEEKEDE